MPHLLITVRLHDGRYHGLGDWPPSPARLFQALVAGAGLSGPQSLGLFEGSLKWLEDHAVAPIIASPLIVEGQGFKTYVPNNDLDSVDGDVQRIAKIRTTKIIKPRVFDPAIPFLYAWTFEESEEGERHAQAICSLAEQLYQFGRPVDMAWAWGEVLTGQELDMHLSNHPGTVFRPSDGGSGRALACPQPGSLQSLKNRYAANVQRFTTQGSGKTVRQLFSQAPKPRFVQVPYDSPPSRRVYELRDAITQATFGPWPLAQVCSLVVWLRDGAAEKLRRALPGRSSEIERVMVGRKANGVDEEPSSSRVKIVPLPSIGHYHADRGIRRVLIEVPASCPLRADDVYWAFSGLNIVDRETGEVLYILIPSSDDSMIERYGINGRFRVWRTVTPAALPEPAKRRRIEPTRLAAEAKGGAERLAERGCAAYAVVHALRHAEVHTRGETIQVQREPFETNGERVEAFAPGTRFAKERLWHVGVTFETPVAGPLVIGDGRFLGLGVMAPVQRSQGVYAFVVPDGVVAAPQPIDVARALRRAVMARVQQVLGSRQRLPTFFTGHDRDSSPAQTESSPHLTCVFDPGSIRLFVIAPHVLDHREPMREEIDHLQHLQEALIGFRELCAGSSGRLILRATAVALDVDPLFAPSQIWESVTPYCVTRHMKDVGVAEALSSDIRVECHRRGLPEPRVAARELRGLPGIGLVGTAHLTFKVVVGGPIILGRSRHFGGGLFRGSSSATALESSGRVAP